MKNHFTPLIILMALIPIPSIAGETKASQDNKAQASKDAEKVPTRKPSSVRHISPELVITVTYGDKISTFVIGTYAGSHWLNFHNTYGEEQTVQISEKNRDFFVAKTKDFGEPADVGENCGRQSVQVDQFKDGKKQNTWAACLGGRTDLAQKLTSLANALSNPP